MTQVALAFPDDDDESSPFESAKQTDENGEFWSGRDMQALMGYNNWRDFANSVERASAACQNSGERSDLHIEGARKISDQGYGQADFRLTRFGAYLVAMNGDPRKREVAAAQAYFAIKTREAEVRQTHQLPQSFSEALQLAADQAREIEAKGKEIAELTPRAQQADHYRAAAGLTAIGTFASDLQVWAKENHEAKILHDEVRDFMAELGLLIRGNTIRNNEPTADAQKRGLMRIKNSTFDRGDGEFGSGRSARLTQKGCGYVWDRAVKRIAEHGSLKPLTDLDIAS